jgi:hypothetical protein
MLNLGWILRSWRHHEEMNIREASELIGLERAVYEKLERGGRLKREHRANLVCWLLSDSEDGRQAGKLRRHRSHSLRQSRHGLPRMLVVGHLLYPQRLPARRLAPDLVPELVVPGGGAVEDGTTPPELPQKCCTNATIIWYGAIWYDMV